MKILIAEDDSVSRDYIRQILSLYGHCDTTIDGMEAIEAFLLAHEEGNPYDLVCLDVMMPKIDGIKVLTTIRQLEEARGVTAGNRVKIIVTTALGETDYISNALNSGMEAYLSKPIERENLEQALTSVGLI